MAYETIIYEKLEGNVARITLNRPEVRNAQDTKMIKELDDAFKKAEADDEVRVIILAAAGPCFSSGHDLKEGGEVRKNLPKPGAEGRMKLEEEIYLDPCLRWRDIQKPTIAQVHSYCIMGGLMLAAVCDIIIASEDALFAERAVRERGAAVEYFCHPWEFGIRKTKEMLFTGDFIGAEEAYRLGMVNHVVPRDKLEEETLKLARKIALQDPFALKMAKLAVNQTWDIMGFRNAIIAFFTIHQLTHSHRGEIGYTMTETKSVKEFLKERDAKFEQV
jgi:enoyl-CoA hydratase